MGVSAASYEEVTEFRKERKRLATEALAICDTARTEKRDMSPEENEKFEKMVKDADTLGERIEKREKLWRVVAADEADLQLIPKHLRGQYQETGGLTEKEQRQAEIIVKYMQAPDANTASHILHSAQKEYRDIQLSNPTAGGYLVLPEQLSSRILKKVDNILFLSKLATSIKLTDTKTLGIPSVEVDFDPLQWTSEISQIPENTAMSFGKRAMTLNPLRTRVKVSEVWLQTMQPKQFWSSDDNDGLSVTPMSFIENRLAFRIAYTKEANFFLGNGVTQPLGIFTNSTRGITGGTNCGSAGSGQLTYAGLVNVKYALKQQYHAKGAWIFHRSIMALLMQLVDTNGRPLLNFSTIPDQPDTLLGGRVYLSEFAPNTIVNGGYIGIYGDFQYYMTAYNPYLQIKMVDQLYAETAQVGFFALHEADGMPVQPEGFNRMVLGA